MSDTKVSLPEDPVSRRQVIVALMRGLPLVALGPTVCSTVGCMNRVEGTGRQQITLIPRSQMMAMSDQAWEEISAGETVCTHRPVVDVVERAARRVAGVAPRNDYRFTVIESETVNAFALPNGRIAVYTGILPYLRNEAALAAVLGHEIGHVVARHGNERMSQTLAANVVVGLAAAGLEATELDDDTRELTVAAISGGASLGILLPYSRRHEYEADRLGATYMAKAGYDPRQSSRFWARFQEMKGGDQPDFFSTHPSDSKRIAMLDERMGAYEALYTAAATRYGTGETVPAPHDRA